MRSIGFRAEKDAIHWAVVEPKTDALLKLIGSGVVNAAATEDTAQSLRHFREQIRLLIDKYKPGLALVRMPETFGRKSRNVASIDSRLRVEGVVIEAAASANVTVKPTLLQGIASLLKSKQAKAYLDGENLRGIEWPNRNKNCREAILAAAAGAGAQE